LIAVSTVKSVSLVSKDTGVLFCAQTNAVPSTAASIEAKTKANAGRSRCPKEILLRLNIAINQDG
jgi:hypothetical protein